LTSWVTISFSTPWSHGVVDTNISEDHVTFIFRVKWSQSGSPKRWCPTSSSHGVTAQETSTCIFIAPSCIFMRRNSCNCIYRLCLAVVMVGSLSVELLLLNMGCLISVTGPTKR